MHASEKQYVYIWEFEVAENSLSEFLRYYGPDGEWTTLFRRANGYLGTWLLRDEDNPARFVTVDRWQSKELHAAFLEEFRQEYEAMDETCESLTVRETRLGNFLQLDQDRSPR